jgi:predicted  nucleic acid-binding Zn-ribbon protein
MSFLDTLKKTAGIAAQVTVSAADTAVSKTRTMASIGRVKLAISSEEDKLKKAYTELGRLFYRDYQAQAEADMTEYQPWCDRAADAREQIQRLTQELETLKAEGKEPKEAPKKPEQEAPQEKEDMSIFADLDDEHEEKPQEQPEAEDAPADAPETPEEPEAAPETEEPAPAEAPAEQAPVVPEINPDIVGTFYIDTSNQGTEV